MLAVDDLTHRYRAPRDPGGYKQALAAVDFHATPGRITGLLGPNGAGKTTAMKLLFGLLPLQSGAITWEGEAVGLAQHRRFGYMPESRSLYRGMRVEDQCVYFARHHGLDRLQARRAVEEWLERLGVAEFRRRRLGSLSLGEQQRPRRPVSATSWRWPSCASGTAGGCWLRARPSQCWAPSSCCSSPLGVNDELFRAHIGVSGAAGGSEMRQPPPQLQTVGCAPSEL